MSAAISALPSGAKAPLSHVPRLAVHRSIAAPSLRAAASARPNLGPVPSLPTPGPGFVAGHVTAIGDSVMVDAQPDLVRDVPNVTVMATVSRQWSDGEAIAWQLRRTGQLGAVVIIGLGTNGPVSSTQFDTMMSILSGASRVVFVTTHDDQPWQNDVNRVLAAGVAAHPGTVLADWGTLADLNPGWFSSDGTHVAIGGPAAQALATLIAQVAAPTTAPSGPPRRRAGGSVARWG
ncbi:MAG TPA: hypothetical protein VKG43_14785 [Acidimicrobiales bacterium]|nr:hypothetical protein [Acidimicrobiales bacterium]